MCNLKILTTSLSSAELPTHPDSAEDFLIFRENKPIWVHKFEKPSWFWKNFCPLNYMWYKKSSWLVKRIFAIARCLCWQLVKVSDEKSPCSFNMVKLTANQRYCLIGMLDARMQIHDNIDPNWAIEACKWSVKITICLFPYIGKSKELNYVRKSAHEMISGSNNPP